MPQTPEVSHHSAINLIAIFFYGFEVTGLNKLEIKKLHRSFGRYRDELKRSGVPTECLGTADEDGKFETLTSAIDRAVREKYLSFCKGRGTVCINFGFTYWFRKAEGFITPNNLCTIKQAAHKSLPAYYRDARELALV